MSSSQSHPPPPPLPLPPPLPPPPPSSSPSPSLPTKPPRRVPPPCWTHEETLALIESYHEKWYSLRRGNLKASHWQEVADSIARRCRFASPSKTSVQCRHKIEKLRKRYRTEKQRAAANAPNRFSSSWNFFKKMDDMDKGPLSSSAVDSDDDHDDGGEEDDDDEDDDDEDVGIVQPINSHHHHHNNNINNNNHHHRFITNGSPGSGGGIGGGGGGFKFRIPSGSRSVASSSPQLGVTGSAKPRNYGRFEETPIFKPHHNPNSRPNPTPNPRFVNSNSVSRPGRSGIGGRSGGKREVDPVADMVTSIRMLGEGFVKMEQMKIEMAKEMEQMRMEMEMKRTEMILESQQKIVEAFAKGISGNKKLKRMLSPES